MRKWKIRRLPTTCHNPNRRSTPNAAPQVTPHDLRSPRTQVQTQAQAPGRAEYLPCPRRPGPDQATAPE